MASALLSNTALQETEWRKSGGWTFDDRPEVDRYRHVSACKVGVAFAASSVERTTISKRLRKYIYIFLLPKLKY